MKEEDLRNMMDSWDNLVVAVRYISENPQYFDTLMSISLDDNVKNSWRVLGWPIKYTINILNW